MSVAAAVGDGDVVTIDAAIARMEAMQGELEAAAPDGLEWFNGLYTKVTTAVRVGLQAGEYVDDGFIHDLDVAFANRYFDAVRAWESDPRFAPRSWAVLLDARWRHGIMPVQYAAAGVNAHINYDLAQALVTTWNEYGHRHVTGDSQWADYQMITGIFDDKYQEFRSDVLKPEFEKRFDKGRMARAADLSSHVVVNETRQLAWVNGRVLWDLQVAHSWGIVSDRRPDYVEWVLDRQTATAGKLMLVDLGDAPAGAPPEGSAPAATAPAAAVEVEDD
ncbi:MAG TPA: DUF5995 family protein [Acidimicrobiales bacterium]|nr:DUF5995 family protein [Acidimicrobiales bacterium]